MLRNILSIIVGYIVMAACTMLGIVGCMLAAGMPLDPKAMPDSLPLAYLVGTLALGTLAAAVGGFITAVIACRKPPVEGYILAGLVLALGVLYALTSHDPVQPVWYVWCLPPTGALGVAAGALAYSKVKQLRAEAA